MKALADTIVAGNALAMAALGRGDTLRCKELLARAFEMACYRHDHQPCHGSHDNFRDDDSEPGVTDGESGLDTTVALQVLTLNNTACLHRRWVRLNVSPSTIVVVADVPACLTSVGSCFMVEKYHKNLINKDIA